MKIGVLIFPAGEINSVELHDALSTCVNIRLYGASSIDKHGEYVFKNYFSGLPMISDDDFFEAFNRLIEENQIDIVFPTHDTVAKFFADNKERIKAKIISADRMTSRICRNKAETYELFKEEEFCPKIYTEIEDFPVFIKPKEGQGAVGAKLLRSAEDIPEKADFSDYVICEYLPGEELTVDCFTDRKGELRIILPRSRNRIFAGVSVSASDVELSNELRSIAQKINTSLKFRGLWWFQLKKDKDDAWKLLEISTRCAGTMCMARARGVNLPLLSVYDAMDWDIDIILNPYHITVDRTLISRYKIDYEYDTVYFDFDDTLIIDKEVYLPAISFLYQCKNKGKKIVLITKHETDIFEDMDHYLIPRKLFDEVHLIDPKDNKAKYIKDKKSIFVDNAYAERKAVYLEHKIPVFDVDAIEVLLDWRV
ncbi:MAG: ATP-grasp domain-containing protein [Johnsonella sp.]|nr:ATP-grasp domain-containing protein [Johnsonella sp.]